MENNELLNILSKLFDEKLDPIKHDINELKQGQLDTRKDISEIKDMLINLDANNGTRHLEILIEIKDLKQKFDRVQTEVNKVEVVTGKNCIEIEYLKAVK